MDTSTKGSRMSFPQRREVLMNIAAARHPDGEPKFVNQRIVRHEEVKAVKQDALKQRLERYPEAT